MALSNQFYSGKYSDVLSALGRRPLELEKAATVDLAIYQVGSLIFVGDIDEAQSSFQIYQAQIENKFPEKWVEFLAICRFYLGIGYVRRSQYQEASKIFATNLQLRRTLHQPSLRADFFVYQGVAFYRFYRGQFKRSQRSAQKAYLAAHANGFIYGQVLALDLMGNCGCRLNEIRRGLFDLERALKLSTEIGNGGIETALKVSLLTYRAQFGIDLKKTEMHLKKAIQELSPQDTYSKVELFLELARQLILRGRVSEAEQFLNQCGELVYKHRNQRQSAVYNHRFAQVLYLRGQFHAAVALLRSVKVMLDPSVDLMNLRRFEGLERKILLRMSEDKPLSPSINRPLTLLDARIQNRTHSAAQMEVPLGEDPLGDLMDAIHFHPESAYASIADSGLWGLLPKALGLPESGHYICVDQLRTGWILVSNGDVVNVPNSVTAPMKKLLLLLSGSDFKSKEFLIEKNWGYDYDPRIHDKLLHATIGKIRKSLGPSYATWIEWSTHGYRLSPQVQVVGKKAPVPNQIISMSYEDPKEKQKFPAILSEGLNHRQLQVLAVLRKKGFIGVKEYSKIYKVCTMTATRDLTGLHRQGRVLKLGRARATKYGLDGHQAAAQSGGSDDK